MESDEEITPLKRHRKHTMSNSVQAKIKRQAPSNSDCNEIGQGKSAKQLDSDIQIYNENSNCMRPRMEFQKRLESMNHKTKSRSNNNADKQSLELRNTVDCSMCNIDLTISQNGNSPQTFTQNVNECRHEKKQTIDLTKNEDNDLITGLTFPSSSVDIGASMSKEKTIKHEEPGNCVLVNTVSQQASLKKQTSINDFFGGKKPNTAAIKNVVLTNCWSNNSTKSLNVTEKNVVKMKNARKGCPFYKKIPGTGITVDAFRYGYVEGCTCYFLTHFHSDHYGGLGRSFNKMIYCSQITSKLVESQLNVSRRYITVLPMNQKTLVEGVQVTLIDANHCPGAVMFLLELPDGKRILHVGDFRAHPPMLECPFLSNRERVIHTLYLDTTYCDPAYTFPPQDDVIKFVVKTARQYLNGNPKTLIVCGTYSIGKEKVFNAIARDRDLKIGVTSSKMTLLKCLEDVELEQRLTLDCSGAGLHVLSMNKLTINALQEHLGMYKKHGYERILAFKPTGWTFSGRLKSLDNITPICRPDVTIYGVPYSEHSSFEELKFFVRTLKPRQIIPTVNIGKKESRDQMNMYFAEWLND